MHNHPPFVLALEPDLRQASVLKRVLRDRVHAEVMVVDSRDAALAATSSRIPDVILLTTLLSPRDEQELIAHLRGLSGAEHVQTHTIPQLASSSHDNDGGQESAGLFGKLRRKKNADPIPGCDPNAFADEVGMFIQRAAELREQAALVPRPVIDTPKRAETSHYDQEDATTVGSDAPGDEPAADADSAWSDPFEWRRPDPASQKSSKKKEAPRKRLVRNAPLAVVAEEEEARREKEEAERRAQEDTGRLEAEQRAREEAEIRAREEAAQLERDRLEAERRAKEDAERRAKEEAERRAKEEAARRAKEEAAKRERERLEAERRAKAEAERRAKEEAERRAKEEAARRAKEEAARLAKEEAERRAREEAERRAKEEAERRAKEEAARRAKEEAERRAKEEAARRAKEEAERRAKEEAAKRERERLEAERLAKEEAERRAQEEEERLRVEAEDRARREAETEDAEFEIDLNRDPFSDFRDDTEGTGALLKLMPVTTWARTADSKRQPSADSARTDDVHQLIAGLSIPHVAAVAYPRGCRIRRVRVPAPRPAPRSRLTRPLILSKRALADARNDQQSGA